MKRFIALFLLVLPTATLSAEKLDCKNAITTPDANECASQDQHRVERRLNVVYQKLLKRLREPDATDEENSEIRQKVITAQKAWVVFREADCDAQYEMYKTGTVRTVIYIACMRAHAERRIKELEKFVPN